MSLSGGASPMLNQLLRLPASPAAGSPSVCQSNDSTTPTVSTTSLPQSNGPLCALFQLQQHATPPQPTRTMSASSNASSASSSASSSMPPPPPSSAPNGTSTGLAAQFQQQGPASPAPSAVPMAMLHPQGPLQPRHSPLSPGTFHVAAAAAAAADQQARYQQQQSQPYGHLAPGHAQFGPPPQGYNVSVRPPVDAYGQPQRYGTPVTGYWQPQVYQQQQQQLSQQQQQHYHQYGAIAASWAPAPAQDPRRTTMNGPSTTAADETGPNGQNSGRASVTSTDSAPTAAAAGSPAQQPTKAAAPTELANRPMQQPSTSTKMPDIPLLEVVEKLCGPPHNYHPDVYQQRKSFYAHLCQFWEQKGQPISGPPSISKQLIDLHRLYWAVKERGGFETVSKEKIWGQVCMQFGVNTNNSSAARMKIQYAKYLFPYECFFERNNTDPEPIIRSLECKKKKKKPTKGPDDGPQTGTPTPPPPPTLPQTPTAPMGHVPSPHRPPFMGYPLETYVQPAVAGYSLPRPQRWPAPTYSSPSPSTVATAKAAVAAATPKGKGTASPRPPTTPSVAQPPPQAELHLQQQQAQTASSAASGAAPPPPPPPSASGSTTAMVAPPPPPPPSDSGELVARDPFDDANQHRSTSQQQQQQYQQQQTPTSLPVRYLPTAAKGVVAPTYNHYYRAPSPMRAAAAAQYVAYTPAPPPPPPHFRAAPVGDGPHYYGPSPAAVVAPPAVYWPPQQQHRYMPTHPNSLRPQAMASPKPAPQKLQQASAGQQVQAIPYATYQPQNQIKDPRSRLAAGGGGVAAAGASTSQQQQAIHQQQPFFPQGSVESTGLGPKRRRRLLARNLPKADTRRLVMALKSGLEAETHWAINVLTVLLYDDSDVMRRDAQFRLKNMPIMLGVRSCPLQDILVDCLKRVLSELYPDRFGTGEENCCSISSAAEDIKKEPEEELAMDERIPVKRKIIPDESTAFNRNSQLPVKFVQRTMPDSLRRRKRRLLEANQWDESTSLGTSDNSHLRSKRLLEAADVNLVRFSCYDSPANRADSAASRVRKRSRRRRLHCEDSIIDATTPFFHSEPSEARRLEWRRRREERCRSRDEEEGLGVSEGRLQLSQRCLALSNLIRGLAFIPGNEAVMHRHRGLLHLYGRLLAFPDAASSGHGVGVEEALREDALVLVCLVAGQLDLMSHPQDVVYPLLDGLLNWVVSGASLSTDSLPRCGTVSARDYGIEALCKMSVLEGNVDLMLATGPWHRLERLVETLTELVSLGQETHRREFGIVLLHALCHASTAICVTLSTRTPAVHNLVAFLEFVDNNMHNVVHSQGMDALRNNVELMGSSVGMVRRAAAILQLLAKTAACRSKLVRHQQRLLQFTMSQLMDSRVAAIIADTLYELRDASLADDDNSVLASAARPSNRKTGSVTEKGDGTESSEERKLRPKTEEWENKETEEWENMKEKAENVPLGEEDTLKEADEKQKDKSPAVQENRVVAESLPQIQHNNNKAALVVVEMAAARANNCVVTAKSS